jgi:DNA-binding transcriptional regulator YhcF (GntR family)
MREIITSPERSMSTHLAYLAWPSTVRIPTMPVEDDPDDPRPLFQRVIDDIRLRIGIGHLPPGTQLPGAAQLAADFGYAHMTIQRALQELKRDGLIYSVKGKGTFIHPKAQERMRRQAEASTPTGPIKITTVEEYQTLVEGYNAKLAAALDDAEATLASGDKERINRIEATLDQIYTEISPAVAAAHLYFLRQLRGHGTRIKESELELPSPGIATFNWMLYGKPDITDEEAAQIQRKRHPAKPTARPTDDGADDT